MNRESTPPPLSLSLSLSLSLFRPFAPRRTLSRSGQFQNRNCSTDFTVAGQRGFARRSCSAEISPPERPVQVLEDVHFVRQQFPQALLRPDALADLLLPLLLIRIASTVRRSSPIICFHYNGHLLLLPGISALARCYIAHGKIRTSFGKFLCLFYSNVVESESWRRLKLDRVIFSRLFTVYRKMVKIFIYRKISSIFAHFQDI